MDVGEFQQAMSAASPKALQRHRADTLRQLRMLERNRPTLRFDSDDQRHAYDMELEHVRTCLSIIQSAINDLH